jgi:hypothetical protein
MSPTNTFWRSNVYLTNSKLAEVLARQSRHLFGKRSGLQFGKQFGWQDKPALWRYVLGMIRTHSGQECPSHTFSGSRLVEDGTLQSQQRCYPEVQICSSFPCSAKRRLVDLAWLTPLVARCAKFLGFRNRRRAGLHASARSSRARVDGQPCIRVHENCVSSPLCAQPLN